MNNNKFVTIVATPENRAAFTELRDSVGGTDKLTFRAIWETMDLDKVKAKVQELKDAEKALKEAAKALKEAAKADAVKKVVVDVDAQTKEQVAEAVGVLFENEVEEPAKDEGVIVEEETVVVEGE